MTVNQRNTASFLWGFFCSSLQPADAGGDPGSPGGHAGRAGCGAALCDYFGVRSGR